MRLVLNGVIYDDGLKEEINKSLDFGDETLCSFCGKKYIITAKHRNYCSKECSLLGDKKHQNEKCHERYLEGLICRHCGKKVTHYKRYCAKCCLDKECIAKEIVRKENLALERYNKSHNKIGSSVEDIKEQSKEYMKNHKNRIKFQQKLLRQIKREWIEEYKKTLKCEKCGENRFYCLEFHHKDPTQKDFSICAALQVKRNIQVIVDEMEKCMVLCGNCHSEFHHFEKLKSGQTTK